MRLLYIHKIYHGIYKSFLIPTIIIYTVWPERHYMCPTHGY